MKKVISLIVALALCAGLACPVFAAAQTFVPSIGYKDGPEIEAVDTHGECLIVTSIDQAEKKATDISQEERDLLLEVYEQLDKGTMKLPIDGNYVIRDLVDVSWMKIACVDTAHGKEEWLKQDNTQIEVTFDMGVKKGVDLIVLVYVDGEWVPAESVKNNGNGTVTVKFEDIGVVAFCVNRDVISDAPQTGDVNGLYLALFAGLMVASAAGLVVLLISWKKQRR